MSPGFWIRTVAAAGAITVVLASGGCQQAKKLVQGKKPEVAVQPRPSEPSGQISLFGQVGDEVAVPFVARAARSLQQHTSAPEGRDFDPDIDATGRLMVFASTRHSVKPDIYVKSVTGSAVTQLTADPASDLEPRFSPDGRRIAFASDRAGNWDIWVMDADGRNLMQVAGNAAQEIHPSWAPEGGRLVYCSLPGPGKQWELWVVNLSEPGTKKFIGYGLFPEWSPQGEKIVFQRARQRGSCWFSLWTIELTDGEAGCPTEVASSADYALVLPTWSGDGRQIAFCALKPSGGASEAMDGGGPSDIWVVDADGRGRIRLTDDQAGNYSPTWSPDGRVYFTSNRDGHETVWSLLPIQGTAMTGPGPAVDGTAQVGTRAP